MANDAAPTDILPVEIKEFRYRRYRLRVTDGPDKGAEKVCEGSELSVGSADGNDLVLSDPTVSRHHFAIEALPQGFLMRDLDSTNGTTLHGYRVGWAYLKPGAVIGAGITTLRFDHLEDEIREPLSLEQRFGRAVGQSMVMRRIFAVLPRIAAAESTVLLEGETGTGKGLVAEAIHQESARAKKPFVVVDCSSIPPTLIEAELFGHQKGAFTGADKARAGAFEAAQGGTIFLDEVGELPLEMQPKLLRALEERTIKRIGSVEPIRLDVRVIAATNQDLRQSVNRGAFRSDLYYRLNVVRLHIPPLRERRDDIEMLVNLFYEQFTGRPDAVPPRELVEQLLGHDWPGTVRELRGAVERAVLMDDPELWREIVHGAPSAPSARGHSVGDEFDATLSFRAAKERAMARWERWYVTELVGRHKGNLSRAARAARMDRTHLRELLRRYNTPVKDES
jgi:DNA-binding NtrC family response regulator